MDTGVEHRLLICTVGTRSSPIEASIKYWKPEHIYFILEGPEVPVKEMATSLEYNPTQLDELHLKDPQDFEECVETIKTLDHCCPKRFSLSLVMV